MKHQIMEFNKLLDQQARLMHQMHPSGVAPLTTSNGSHIPSCKNALFVWEFNLVCILYLKFPPGISYFKDRLVLFK